MIGVGVVFALAMLWLMPRINAARDAATAGEAAATRRFAWMHRLSVAINFVQMVAVLAILVRLLARPAG